MPKDLNCHTNIYERPEIVIQECPECKQPVTNVVGKNLSDNSFFVVCHNTPSFIPDSRKCNACIIISDPDKPVHITVECPKCGLATSNIPFVSDDKSKIALECHNCQHVIDLYY